MNIAHCARSLHFAAAANYYLNLMNQQTSTRRLLGQVAFFWGLGGFFLLLFFAIYRLAPIAWSAMQQPLSGLQYALLIGNSLFMAHSEGYKGFQKAYSPRVVSRALYLRENATVPLALLAPFFCMTYFGAPRKRVIVSWCLTIGIIILILIFQRLPSPWRGILDAGVVVGLTWGVTATLIILYRTMANKRDRADPEVMPGLLS